MKDKSCNNVPNLRRILKLAVFNQSVLNTFREFPEEVRRAAGKAIHDLQKGAYLVFPLSRPMPIVGKGVEELRIKDRTGAYRIFYLATFKDRVFVFHAFTKKTNKTPHKEILLGQRRLREMLDA